MSSSPFLFLFYVCSCLVWTVLCPLLPRYCLFSNRWRRSDAERELKPRSRWLDDAADTSSSRDRKRKKSDDSFEREIPAHASKETIQGHKLPFRPGMTMAERAVAELEAFRRRQQELAAAGGEPGEDKAYALKSSPDVSSPEEELHIRREGNSYHKLQAIDRDDDGAERTTGGAPTTTEVEQEDRDDVVGPKPPPQGEDIHAYYPEVLSTESSPCSNLAEEHNGGMGEEEVDHQGLGRGGIDGRETAEAAREERSPSSRATDRWNETYKQSMLKECRSVDEHYEKLNRISEGTYGVVYRARQIETGKICALKRVKLDKERDGFPLTSIREINVLLSLSHPSIVDVSEIVVGSSLDQVFMVMEYADHDLRGVMEHRMTQPFSTAETKCLMRQLLAGVAYLHENWVIHRDLKTSNILYTNKGQLKICDFGLARQYADPLRPYTHMVVTLWYRAPELLLGVKEYSTAVDMWSCGCIMAEILTKNPIFNGRTEIAQLDQIFRVLGVPDEESWPGVTSLRHWKEFYFKGSRLSSLRHMFPSPGPVFDGRTTLSDAGFDLLSGLLCRCPVRAEIF